MIVGTFATKSRAVASFAEHWNGTSWTVQSVPGGALHAPGEVSCPSATSCTAVGSNLTSSGTVSVHTLAAHWDGTAWTLQHTPNPARAFTSVLSDMSCPSLSVCEAVGLIQVPAPTHRVQGQDPDRGQLTPGRPRRGAAVGGCWYQ
jgi:hypothetical protein